MEVRMGALEEENLRLATRDGLLRAQLDEAMNRGGGGGVDHDLQAKVDALRRQVKQSGGDALRETMLKFSLGLMKLQNRFKSQTAASKSRALWMWHGSCLESQLYDNYSDMLADEQAKAKKSATRERSNSKDKDSYLAQDFAESQAEISRLRKVLEKEKREKEILKSSCGDKDKELSKLRSRIDEATSQIKREKERANSVVAQTKPQLSPKSSRELYGDRL